MCRSSSAALHNRCRLILERSPAELCLAIGPVGDNLEDSILVERARDRHRIIDDGHTSRSQIQDVAAVATQTPSAVTDTRIEERRVANREVVDRNEGILTRRISGSGGEGNGPLATVGGFAVGLDLNESGL